MNNSMFKETRKYISTVKESNIFIFDGKKIQNRKKLEGYSSISFY